VSGGGDGGLGLPAGLGPLGTRGTAAREVPGVGVVRGLPDELRRIARPLQAFGTVPQPLVQACRAEIVAAARPYGVVRVDAASAGSIRRIRGGGLSAPLEMRTVYARRGGLEARQARVTCTIDGATGRVALR
jgi:hypothetical protein